MMVNSGESSPFIALIQVSEILQFAQMFDIISVPKYCRSRSFCRLDAMVKVRRVYVVTSNPERVPEFQRLLQLYGIEVCHASPFGYRTKSQGPQALLPLAETLGRFLSVPGWGWEYLIYDMCMIFEPFLEMQRL